MGNPLLCSALLFTWPGFDDSGSGVNLFRVPYVKSGKNRVCRAGVVAGALCFLRRFGDIDRKFRTEGLTEMTAHAAIRFFKDRVVVAFDIKFGRHGQYVARAIFDAEFTTLAAIFNDNYVALADMNFVGVKGRSPKVHTIFSLEVWSVLSSLREPAVSGVFVKRWTTIRYW